MNPGDVIEVMGDIANVRITIEKKISTANTESGSSAASQDHDEEGRIFITSAVDLVGQDRLLGPSPSSLGTETGTSSESEVNRDETDDTSKDSDEDVCSDELDITEEHFNKPEMFQGWLGLSSISILEEAIENCKEMILESPENSKMRKALLKRLIQLRIKVQDLKDQDNLLAEGRFIHGHKFFPQKQISGSKKYCDRCAGLIWTLIQSWFQCVDCHFKSHVKCLNLVIRTCAAARVAQNVGFSLQICPETGLSTQCYRCAECRVPLTVTALPRTVSCMLLMPSSESYLIDSRLCDYDGQHYCSACHWNDQAIIPARVLHNWDFEERRVCRASKQLISLLRKKPILNIKEINPLLFSYVEELNKVKHWREDLFKMKNYLTVCKNARKSRLLMLLSDRQHFVESTETYSLQDLVDTNSGVLLDYLEKVRASFVKHIKEDCQICYGKGFICELCRENEVIFPFDDIATSCPQCSSVFHRQCFEKKNLQCPKCERLIKRSQREDILTTES